MIYVEEALIKYILVTIGNDYLKELSNAGTDAITISIFQVLKHLVTGYVMVDSYVLYR